MLSLAVTEFVPSNSIAKHTRSIYSIRLTTKNLVKDVLEPLEATGLIESRKTTIGRGAKPHDVRLAERGKNDLLGAEAPGRRASRIERDHFDLLATIDDVRCDFGHDQIGLQLWL